tara:strand:+ start:331 stop:672 length:342 start_codon:yes stop_codon:yes gene_type:complete
MAGVKFKRKDKNRWRKVYPFLRRKPVYAYCADKEVVMETGYIDYSNASSGTYSFTPGLFTGAPTITAISVDNLSNNTANVNVFVTAVSTTSVTIDSSALFTGRVHFHAIYIAP